MIVIIEIRTIWGRKTKIEVGKKENLERGNRKERNRKRRGKVDGTEAEIAE
jgi:hypothetical protein